MKFIIMEMMMEEESAIAIIEANDKHEAFHLFSLMVADKVMQPEFHDFILDSFRGDGLLPYITRDQPRLDRLTGKYSWNEDQFRDASATFFAGYEAEGYAKLFSERLLSKFVGSEGYLLKRGADEEHNKYSEEMIGDFPLEMKAFMWRKTWFDEVCILPLKDVPEADVSNYRSLAQKKAPR